MSDYMMIIALSYNVWHKIQWWCSFEWWYTDDDYWLSLVGL